MLPDTIGFLGYKVFTNVRFLTAFSDIPLVAVSNAALSRGCLGQRPRKNGKGFIFAEYMHSIGSTMSDRTIDDTDIKIIRSLQEDARKPFKEIADQCGVSTETVKNRFNAMRKNGIIRGTTVVVDPRKLNKKHIVIIGIQTTQPYSNQVLRMVKKITGMCVATRAVGRYDVEAIAVMKDIEQIGSMKGSIGDFKQVQNVDVDIFVDKPLLCPSNFEFD